MARSSALQPLLKIVSQKNDAARKKLGSLNRNRQQAQDKLAMLQQYRRDYLLKLQQHEQDGMDLEEIRNFREFILRLDDAIRQQSSLLDQATDSVTRGQGELREAQLRMKSIDTLIQRQFAAERKREVRLEQKAMDEFSTRQATISRMNDGNNLGKDQESNGDIT